MNRSALAALAALLLAGCGPFNWTPTSPTPVPRGCCGWPDFERPNIPVVAQAADDTWAAKAFGVYGNDAVHTCLAAFHQDLVKGELDTGVPAKPLSYRTQLAEFMCACARGQSAEACPDVLAD
jgi:hypothetical protein